MQFSDIKDFDRTFDAAVIETKVAEAKAAATSNSSTELLKDLFSFIDLTTLNATDTNAKGISFAEKVNEVKAKYGLDKNVGAICVYPKIVPAVRQALKDENVNIAAVSAGFPSSMTFWEIKEAETKMTVARGANEIDIVISLGDFLAEDYRFVFDEIVSQKNACGDAHLKVILETGALTTPEAIWKASVISMYAGADFIKTSTGKMDPAATLEAAYVMCEAIKFFEAETGTKIGFKPAGGIVTTQDALEYYNVVKIVLGEEWLNPHLFRLGASRLANNLLTDITGETVSFF